MKTTFDFVDILYEFLKTSSLKDSITGKVYKYERPVDSVKEDIVINSLPVTTGQLQTAILNLNIFVPDIIVSVSGVQTGYANNARMKVLTGIAFEELDEWTEDYNFNVQQQTLIKDNESSSHFINIRLEFYSINISN